MYNKIYRNMRFLCALVLSLSTLLFLAAVFTFFNAEIKRELTMFLALAVFAVLMGIFIYIIFSLIAARLALAIVKPITDASSLSSDIPYEEIKPLIKQIRSQNKELGRQAEKAKAQKMQLQLITDNMNEGLIVIDKNANILSINSYAAKIFSLKEYEVKQKHYSVLTENSKFIDAVSKALENNRTSILIEMDDADYRVFCSPVIKDGLLNGVVILLFDVTTILQSEKLRREFSANVSHELKTPLTSINGYAQLITNGIASPDDVPSFAAKIAKESNRLMLLIEDIIRLSNLDESDDTNCRENFRIKETVCDVISALFEKASARNIALQCEGPDFFICANKSQITELLYNICDNAIKYNKDNGEVTFTLADATVRISDTGIGIPPQYLSRIFERFFRVDKSHSKKVDGTGLGLSIAKHIARQNNVTISVESELQKGTSFILTFKDVFHQNSCGKFL